MRLRRIAGSIISVAAITAFVAPASHASTAESTETLEAEGDSAQSVLVVRAQDTDEVIYTEVNDHYVDANGEVEVTVQPEEVALSQAVSAYEETAEISPQDSVGGSQTGTVTSTLNIEYNRNANEQIRLENVNGTWSPRTSGIEMQNRHVRAIDGRPVGNATSWNPTSNSFSYNTGWGYVNHYPQSDEGTGPRAFTEVDYRLTGNLTWLTQELWVYVPNPG